MPRNVSRVTVVALGFVVLMLGGAPSASAHEHRQVGRWGFTVGWGSEPTYAGYLNGVQLILAGPGNRPVVDLGDTLKVEVILGSDKTAALTLEPAFEVGEFGTPGDYQATLIPTRPGNYTFHFTGTIKGDAIDVSFTASDTTFSPVKEPADVQFPAKDPSSAQIAQRLDREFPRIDAASKALARSVDDDVSNAKTIAYVGGGVGALGLLAALAALMRRRPKATPAA